LPRQEGLDDADMAAATRQGCSGGFGSSDFVVAALMASIGMGELRAFREYARCLLARARLISRP